jgi:carbon-monoxide dehydrogenase large subunit
MPLMTPKEDKGPALTSTVDAPDAERTKYVGKPLVGRKNRQLSAGRGQYVADLYPANVAYMAVLRSPHAHARILDIDVTRADVHPGVLSVITGREIREKTRPIPQGWDTEEVGAHQVDWYSLCVDRARYVGEAVAAVVAESKYAANEALSLIDVSYELLPAVVDLVEAVEPGAALVEPEWGTNQLVSRDLQVGDVGVAFERAAGVVQGRITTHRGTGVPIEPRGIIASYDARREMLTLWDSTQNPHPLRVYLAQTLDFPESKIRVIQPDVGGAFGLKQPTFQEEPLIAYLALRLRRPIKWIEERHENFAATGHAREMVADYRAAYDDEGVVTAMDVDIVADVGAPTALVGWGMAFAASGLIPGPYRVPNTRVRLKAVVTNKTPWNAYRGFGKDIANLWLERAMDDVAKATGLDRAEVRFRNFLGADEFPFARERGGIVDSGDYHRSLRRAMDLINYAGFEERRREASEEGRLIGLGLGHELTPEGCAMPGSVMISAYDGATVRIGPSGEVTVLSGVTSPGNGNETALAQIAADGLGCRIEDVRVLQGDTLLCPWGLGNYSSRGIIIGGSAVGEATDELREKILDVAAHMLEASTDDLELYDSEISVVGAPSRSVSLADVARQVYRHPYGPAAENVEPGLEATRYFRSPNIYHQPATQGRFSAYPTWPSAAAACVVEVDPETGYVKVLDYHIVEDAGTIINPKLVDANLHGATAQALGGAFFEQLSYDGSGQLLTATLMDYTIPTAVEMPRIGIEHQMSPSPFTPLGTKGAGESGLGCALSALVSAVDDALGALNVRIDEIPMTPARVWRAIVEAGVPGRE